MIVSWSLWCDFLGAGGRSGTGSPPFAGFGDFWRRDYGEKVLDLDVGFGWSDRGNCGV